MHQREWASIVARLNLNWPGQQITTPTADEWFGPTPDGRGTGPLADFPAVEVWEAIDRCRRDLRPGADGRPRGAWLPNLADILAAIDANWRDAAATRRELEAVAARAARNSRGGVPMPSETKQALEVLQASKSLPGTPGYVTPGLARRRCDEFADQLDERVGREQMGQLT